MTNQVNFNAICWSSRRGMLELDLFLLPFCDAVLLSLSTLEIESFVAILQIDDPTLLAWLMGYEQPEDKFNEIIARIRHYRTVSCKD